MGGGPGGTKVVTKSEYPAMTKTSLIRYFVEGDGTSSGVLFKILERASTTHNTHIQSELSHISFTSFST